MKPQHWNYSAVYTTLKYNWNTSIIFKDQYNGCTVSYIEVITSKHLQSNLFTGITAHYSSICCIITRRAITAYYISTYHLKTTKQITNHFTLGFVNNILRVSLLLHHSST